MIGPIPLTTVLIVDDEQAIADTLGAIFRMHGYDARVAYSAEEAVENIASCVPDLALLDVNLPGMNGIDLAIVLKANHPQCHLLLVSGHESTRGLLEEAAKKGHIFDILAKPVHPTLILERAKGLLSAARGGIALAGTGIALTD
jgi:DNA-binding response OmpR family regulator